MIFCATDENRFATNILQDTREIGMKTRAHLGVLQKGHAIFRAEDEMQDNSGE